MKLCCESKYVGGFASIREAEEILDETVKIVFRGIMAQGATILPNEIKKLLKIIQYNAHYILFDRSPVALGLFPLTSMLNHSCDPNAAHYFVRQNNTPPELVFVAIRDIRVGEEVCYSYIPLYQSTASRNEQLNACYGFKCICRRCAANASQVTSHDDVYGAEERSVNNYPIDDLLGDSNIAGDVSFAGQEYAKRVSTAFDTLDPTRPSESFRALLALLPSASDVPEERGCMGEALASCSSSLTLDLSHVLNLRIYSGLASYAQEILEENGVAEVAVCHGILALGCVLFYTRAHQQETADLQYYISRALQVLRAAHAELDTVPSRRCERGEDPLGGGGASGPCSPLEDYCCMNLRRLRVMGDDCYGRRIQLLCRVALESVLSPPVVLEGPLEKAILPPLYDGGVDDRGSDSDVSERTRSWSVLFASHAYVSTLVCSGEDSPVAEERRKYLSTAVACAML